MLVNLWQKATEDNGHHNAQVLDVSSPSKLLKAKAGMGAGTKGQVGTWLRLRVLLWCAPR